MVTGYEVDQQRAIFSIAMSLKKIAEELEEFNKNFKKIQYKDSAICTMDVSKF